MAKVLGISGVFLFANDPVAMKNWYSAHFGLDLKCFGEATCYGADMLHQLPDGRRSHTVFSIMKAKEKLKGRRKECMVNWRVEDLDLFLDGLAAAGIQADKREDYDYGRFAWITDPEGNPVELYQPLMEPGTF